MTNEPFIVATDGSSITRGGKRRGGWGYVRQDGTAVGGYFEDGTNNQAELAAIYHALDHHHKVANLTILADSQYAIKCVTEWIVGWKKNGWMTSAGKPVKNQGVIVAIDQLLLERHEAGFTTTFEWVRGHNGHGLNELADTMATASAEQHLSLWERTFELPHQEA